MHDNTVDFEKIFSKMLDVFLKFSKINPSKISRYTVCVLCSTSTPYVTDQKCH